MKKLIKLKSLGNLTSRDFPLLKSLTPLYLLVFFLFGFTAQLQANVISPLTTKAFSDFHQCDKKFEYDVYFLGGKVGYLHRKIKWDNNAAAASKATVTSYGEVTFLWLDSTYQQKSAMHYSPQDNHFLTPRFSQKLTGLKSRVMTAEISDNGLSSTVTLDTKVSHYQHTDNNESNPLYDLDTLGAQIRLNLLQGNTRFTLFRQASKKVERYQFEVAGQEVITHEKWGDLTTVKVVEVGEHENIVLWFSRKHDHQLVKAELDMIFSPVVWLSHFSKQCNT
ncbi:DUF3108 domain-containing protein [Colwellia demingiae]|uniref:DUF3108 domain-containing protein n=1 Tax=Colwellia demingiae TaxID=89401 RepID=A0A5C6QGJ3_9GAMM|nr:DUF3108 domain-containing protein [Colwellia demingiae]